MSELCTTQQFIEKAKTVHCNLYDYSKVEYVNSRTKIKIICRIHSEFFQLPQQHLQGAGCQKCGKNKPNNTNKTTDQFINDARIVHGNKYNYNKTVYVNNKTKVIISCPIHSDFYQIPSNHLIGFGCYKCAKIKTGNDNRHTLSQFIIEANTIHNNKYSYDKVNYIHCQKKIEIFCNIHNEYYQQTPSKHLLGRGCPKCGRYAAECKANKLKMTAAAEFIAKANKVHNNLYDYSLAIYVGAHINTSIICGVHGTYEQLPSHHLKGHGCPYCYESSGERHIKLFLEQHNILFLRQVKFKSCCFKNRLPFDFAINYNGKLILIEYNGQHHYKPTRFNGISIDKAQQLSDETKARDIIKSDWCKKNSNLVDLLVIPYTDYNRIDEILTEYFNL